MYLRTRSHKNKQTKEIDVDVEEREKERKRRAKEFGEIMREEIEISNRTQTDKYKDYIREKSHYRVVTEEQGNDNSKGLIGYQVPIRSQEELDGWMKFLELDNGNPIAFGRFYAEEGCLQERVIHDLGHPFIGILAEFAVRSFHEICLKVVKAKGCPSVGLIMTRILKATYISEFARYIIDITFEAMEDGVSALFIAKVEAGRFNGSKTLVKFSALPLQLYGELGVIQPDLSDLIDKAERGGKKAKHEEMMESAMPSGLSNRSGVNICMAYNYVIPLREYRVKIDA